MSLDKASACEILGVSRGASENDIRSAYRHLALKWHPDKHANNDKATEKFQEISAAYKCLTTEDKDAQVLTMDDMFDLFAQMFFNSRAFYNGFAFGHSDDDYDDESDDDFSWEQVEKNQHFTKKKTEFSYTANRPSASEASKNADELMKEEERQKKNREKRKSKKKRQREKKREEKEKQEEEAMQKAEEQRKKEEFLKKAKESAEKAKRQAEHRNNSTNPTNPHLDATKSTSTSRVNNNNNISNSLNSARNKARAQFDSRSKTRVSESSDSDRDEDIAGWDQHSAFFAGAAATANKKMATTTNSRTEKPRKKSSQKAGRTEEAESVRAMNSGQIDSMDPVVLQSRQFAVKGNEMANLGHYSTAIDLFTQAISLDPRDFRFFGNRSFCYDRLQQYESALKDANRAISLAKEWPKGYFRKGRALAGLKRYAEAETAFEDVLKLDKNCEDAVEELHKTRISRLMEMGFNRPQCDAAIRQYGSVQSALDALLINGVEGVSSAFPEDVYISDEEDYITQTIETSKLDARNPLSLRSLWVGNLHSTVSEKELRDRFGQFGEIESLRRLPDRFCAFINYKRPDEAARALDQLQGVEVGGRFLLIKFPDNPIVDGQPRTMVLKKNTTGAGASASTSTSTNNTSSSSSSSHTSHTKAPASQQQSGSKGSSSLSNYNNHADASGDKVTGPVNGNECYFWRTTGCVFGDRCKYKHLVKAKGADLKPWQKVVYD